MRLRSHRGAQLLLSGVSLALLLPASHLQAQEEEEYDPYAVYSDDELYGEDYDDSSLAAAAQNPLADLVNLPFQNNTSFGIGPFDRTANLINIQPVIPVGLSRSLNLVNRAIIPIVSAPDVAQPEGTTWGLGDLTYTPFFSSANPGALIWGAGPALVFPTGTSDATGSGKWSAGPAIVLLGMPGRMVIGAVAWNTWSYAGSSDRDDVNSLLIQYFVNYNFEGGWFVTSAPIITSDWTQPAYAGWVVPFGVGFGRVFPIGRQPLNLNIHYYYNVVTPETEDGTRLGAGWSLRFTFQLLFPKG